MEPLEPVLRQGGCAEKTTSVALQAARAPGSGEGALLRVPATPSGFGGRSDTLGRGPAKRVPAISQNALQLQSRLRTKPSCLKHPRARCSQRFEHLVPAINYAHMTHTLPLHDP